MRLALLSKPKFAAVVNNFSDKETVCDELTAHGCVNLKDLFLEGCQDLGIPVPKQQEKMSKRKSLPTISVRNPKETAFEEDQDEDSVFDNAVTHVSMSKEEAENRFIEPDNIVMGGKTSVSMYEFVPSEGVVGMEDFLEESDYYDSYKNVSSDFPITMKEEEPFAFPQRLDAFVHPKDNFDHFKV